MTFECFTIFIIYTIIYIVYLQGIICLIHKKSLHTHIQIDIDKE